MRKEKRNWDKKILSGLTFEADGPIESERAPPIVAKTPQPGALTGRGVAAESGTPAGKQSENGSENEEGFVAFLAENNSAGGRPRPMIENVHGVRLKRSQLSECGSEFLYRMRHSYCPYPLSDTVRKKLIISLLT